MRKAIILAATAACAACSHAPPIKSAPDSVSFTGRIVKAQRVERESTGSYTAWVPVGGIALPIPTGAVTSRSYGTTMYTLSIKGHEPVEVDSSGGLSVGQCVILYVKAHNAENTRFFPASGQLEPYDRCPE